MNISIPLQNTTSGLAQYDNCNVYIDPLNHSLGTKRCPTGKYQFQYEDGERQSVITEWALVCDNKYLARILQTSFYVGAMVGGTTWGFLADYYGRWKVWIIVVVGQTITGIALTFISCYEIFCCILCLQGIFCLGQSTVSYTLFMEQYPIRYRTKAGIFLITMPPLSMSFSNFFAYFITEWRYQITAHALTNVVSIIGFWFVQESFRWMLSNQQIEEATKTARTVAKFNAITLPHNLNYNLEGIANEIQATMKMTKKQNMSDMMRHPFARRTCLILFFNMFSNQISFYGFVFMISYIGGNIYTNLIIIAIMDVILRTVSYFPIERFGRTKTTAIPLLAIGIINIIFVGTKSYEGYHPSLGVVSLVISIIGRAFNGVYFCATWLQSQEIFPTTVRSMASGVMISTGRLGLLLLPSILLLGDYIWKQLPFLIFGMSNVIGGLLALLLPETKGKVMPNTVEEFSNLYQPRKMAEQQLAETITLQDNVEKTSQNQS